MTTDTARRERAEGWLRDRFRVSPGEVVWSEERGGDSVGQGGLIGYLAGAREEAAIKDAEIAALREAVRYCYNEGKPTREVEDAIDRARGRG